MKIPPKLLWTTSGIVEAPVEPVTELLFAPYEPTKAHAYVELEIDRSTRTLTQSGAWWYRGVNRVEPHARGALVTFELYNIAQVRRWMVGGILLQHRFSGSLRSLRTGGLPERLRAIGIRLGCRTELVESHAAQGERTA